MRLNGMTAVVTGGASGMGESMVYALAKEGASIVGEADANNDNEITAGELHSYVQTNVIQQSSGSQTPELRGNADRVLVTFK